MSFDPKSLEDVKLLLIPGGNWYEEKYGEGGVFPLKINKEGTALESYGKTIITKDELGKKYEGVAERMESAVRSHWNSVKAT